jgi:dipeptidyl aminopeptidase/acylaminoacyl peptidase
LGLVDYFVKLPSVDVDRLFTIGISLGGFRSLYLLGCDSRIKAGTLVVTGDSLTKSIVLSELELAKNIREFHMKNYNISSLYDYELFLKDYSPVSPLDLLCARPSDNFFLIMAENDKSVPSFMQSDLWQGLGYPLAKKVNHNHRKTILYYALSYLDNTYRFFKNIWKKPVK